MTQTDNRQRADVIALAMKALDIVELALKTIQQEVQETQETRETQETQETQEALPHETVPQPLPEEAGTVTSCAEDEAGKAMSEEKSVIKEKPVKNRGNKKSVETVAKEETEAGTRRRYAGVPPAADRKRDVDRHKIRGLAVGRAPTWPPLMVSA